MKGHDPHIVGEGWFAARRNHFIRRALSDFFTLAADFQALFARCLACSPSGKEGDAEAGQESGEAWGRMHRSLAEMVGTERDPGPLWQLKDRCHRIWPQSERERHGLGAQVDWLVGSLFHEAMKLKEDLYLLGTYGPAAAAMGGIGATGPLSATPVNTSRTIGMQTLIGRTHAAIQNQLARMENLLAQVAAILRQMLPELAANPLVLRLLVEREQAAAELWGESLEALFADAFAGRVADGFCLAGASYLHGHWLRQALAMFRRALTQEPDCDEAVVRIAHIEATLRATSGEIEE